MEPEAMTRLEALVVMVLYGAPSVLMLALMCWLQERKKPQATRNKKYFKGE